MLKSWNLPCCLHKYFNRALPHVIKTFFFPSVSLSLSLSVSLCLCLRLSVCHCLRLSVSLCACVRACARARALVPVCVISLKLDLPWVDQMRRSARKLTSKQPRKKQTPKQLATQACITNPVNYISHTLTLHVHRKAMSHERTECKIMRLEGTQVVHKPFCIVLEHYSWYSLVLLIYYHVSRIRNRNRCAVKKKERKKKKRKKKAGLLWSLNDI